MTTIVKCPIYQGESNLDDCLEIKRKIVEKEGEALSDDRKVCGLAMLCWQCPARNLTRKIGGDWHEPENRPEGTVEFPAEDLHQALIYTGPSNFDFGRVGVSAERGQKLAAHLTELRYAAIRTRRGTGRDSELAAERGEILPSFSPTPGDRMERKTVEKLAPTPKPKIEPKQQVESGIVGADMSKLIQAKIADEMQASKSEKSPQSAPTIEMPQTTSQPHKARRSEIQSAPAPTMTLAERAKLMKQRRAAQ